MTLSEKTQNLPLADIRQGLGVGPLPNVGIVIIEGQDSGRFLQSQSTNDIGKLDRGEGCWSASVDRQGKIQGYYYAWRFCQDEYWLLLDRVQIPDLITHLEKFHILEPFTIRDASEEYKVFALLGARAIEMRPIALGYWLQLDRFGTPGIEWIVPVAQAEDAQRWLEALHEILLSEEILDTFRIEAGLPKFGVDMDNTTLLPETGLQQIAVSYDKGCYLGQEVIARVKTYGAVQKALVGLTLSALPEFNAPIIHEGKTIGTYKSAIVSSTLNQPIALAYLDKIHRTPGLKLGDATVVSLPFVKTTTVTYIQPAQAKLKLSEGLAKFSQSEDDDAIVLLNEAIALDPKLADAYEALGVILGRHERIDEAIDLMHKLLEVAPDHVLAHTNLSIFWLKKGDKDKAEEEKAKATVAGMRQAAKAAGLDFAKLDAQRQEAEAAKIKQLEERIELFKQALSFSPDDPLGNFGIGSCYLDLQRYAEAIIPFEKTINAQPSHTVAYLSLGKALEATGEFTRAKEIYKKGIPIASARGDMMPLSEMQQRLEKLT